MSAFARQLQRLEKPPLSSLLAVASVVFVTAWLGIELTRESGRIASIWLANGALLAVLLSSPQKRWPSYLLAAYIANVGANTFAGDAGTLSMSLAATNSIEVICAAFFIRHTDSDSANLTRWPVLLRFAGLAVLLAPAISGIIACIILHLATGAEAGPTFAKWYLADALGIAIVTPLGIAVRNRAFTAASHSAQIPEFVISLLVLALCTFGIFFQTDYPLLFLIFPLLVVIAFRLGYTGTVTAIAIISTISIILTVMDRGPFSLIAGSELTDRVLLLQVYIACCSAMALPIVASLAERTSLAKELANSHETFLLFAENSTDMFVNTTAEGKRLYVSAGSQALLGYTPKEMMDAQTTSLLHPDDLLSHEACKWGIHLGRGNLYVLL